MSTETPVAAVPADAPQTQNLDPEFEKRKARAARFGIPFLETTKPKSPRVQQGKRPAKETKLPEVSSLLQQAVCNLAQRCIGGREIEFPCGTLWY